MGCQGEESLAHASLDHGPAVPMQGCPRISSRVVVMMSIDWVVMIRDDQQ